MANYALMTAVGKDRPGIVAGASRVLLASDCNIEDSRMARLGGDFCMMLLLRLPEGLTGEQVADRMKPVCGEFELTLTCADIRPEEAQTDAAVDHPKHVIRVDGTDRQGIVFQLTQQLSAQSVNITDLRTEVIPDDPPRYAMVIEVELPRFVDAKSLAADLADTGNQLGVRVSLSAESD
jgi:glycine cleavage system transcriptional repressor